MRRAALLAAALLLGGCSEVQSVLAPAGPEAERLLGIAMALFVGALAVMAIVLTALWLALRGPEAARRRLALERSVVVGGIAFPVVTLTALLAYGLLVMRESAQSEVGDPDLRIEVVGEQWWWRVAYLLPGGRRLDSANEVRIPAGREVEFTLASRDVIHSFWVPSLAGKVDMIPGRSNRLRLTTAEPGIYRGQCAEYCGGAHARMAFEVVALRPADFDRWLAQASAPAREPRGEVASKGRALFLAAGCGTCHTVRGTQAKGIIGPDLTRIGERRFIAAATLPMTPDNLARFIVDGQHVKPGNGMPPFRIFTGEELEAIAAYLAGLE